MEERLRSCNGVNSALVISLQDLLQTFTQVLRLEAAAVASAFRRRCCVVSCDSLKPPPWVSQERKLCLLSGVLLFAPTCCHLLL